MHALLPCKGLKESTFNLILYHLSIYFVLFDFLYGWPLTLMVPTQRQNLRTSSPSDPRIAANVSQDVNIVDVCGHMRSPFDTAVSRKLFGGSTNDASFLASKWIGDHVGDLTTRPLLVTVFDGVLPIQAFFFRGTFLRVISLQTCQFNTIYVAFKKGAFQWIWKVYTQYWFISNATSNSIQFFCQN